MVQGFSAIRTLSILSLFNASPDAASFSGGLSPHDGKWSPHQLQACLLPQQETCLRPIGRDWVMCPSLSQSLSQERLSTLIGQAESTAMMLQVAGRQA